jgi:hypothetical protein
LYKYKNKDGNPSTKNTRHVEANVNTQKETKTIKIVVMKWKTECKKGIFYHKSTSDGGALANMCGRDEL